jgi:hypothetical protein
MVAHLGPVFISKKDQHVKIMEYCWNTFFKLEDAQVKNWGYLSLCALFLAFESPPKLVMNVIVYKFVDILIC